MRIFELRFAVNDKGLHKPAGRSASITNDGFLMYVIMRWQGSTSLQNFFGGQNELKVSKTDTKPSLPGGPKNGATLHFPKYLENY